MEAKPLVGVIMGSKSDWDTMRHAAEILESFDVPYEKRIVSAHRTPRLLSEYAASAEARGLEVIVAGAPAERPIRLAWPPRTPLLPVLGVPVESHALKGMDSLLSIVQMLGRSPGGDVRDRQGGRHSNAALFAVAITSSASARAAREAAGLESRNKPNRVL